ncbi:MAG: signal recognition particle protein [Gammaproteobacteria bacterium]|nr:signal recognition particle protein [Gammaproteobacteria bacterium]
MFSNLSEKLTSTIKNLSGRGRLTDDNIKETLREIRMALLEADVALPVVKKFIAKIQEVALGQKVLDSLRPGETLVKIVHDEMINIMGETLAEINLNTEPPAVILVAGLQGSGKTTTTAKLAKLLKENKKKSVMVTSTDIYRPAAIKQLETLAEQIDVHYFPSNTKQKPVDIAKAAIKEAKKKFIDIVIVDTAGRLHIDQEMMAEISAIHKAINPIETLFVIDSMTGQDAVNTAKAFNDTLPLTGVILTKTDGDARGGAALSVRMITGKPIKFIGVGEKIDAFEVFHPDRIVSRILGMGDILTLVEETQTKIDQKKAEKVAKKIMKGKGFDLEDFRDQLQQLKSMGGIGNLLGKLPGMGALPKAAKGMVDDKMFTKMEAMINSMTGKERRFPAIIKGSRKRRIAEGSGNQIQDVNRLIKQFTQMQKMMKKLKGGKMLNMMKNMQGMQGFDGFPQ